jgi:hypothetical protein
MMADAALDGGNTSGDDGNGGVVERRRSKTKPGMEEVDELTLETKRETLLDQMEGQLKPGGNAVPTVSRLLFAVGLPDERKAPQVDKAFLEWLAKQPDYAGGPVTGVLLYIGSVCAHFLEGPTESLFQALTFFNTLTAEGNGLLGSIRVLYFTELHGSRVSVSWCSYSHQSKLLGSQTAQLEDGAVHESVFIIYQKLLLLCLKVQDAVGNDASFDKVQAQYKKLSEMMPSADDTIAMMAKNSIDYFFTFTEFEKVFIAPFHCVLHSELLWPMAPALVY